jgi:16S rRNA (guanine527-N7)-methyltransferase
VLVEGRGAMSEPPAVVDLYGEHLESIKRYVDILASRGVDYGLIGPREADRLWERHVLNSAAISELVPQAAGVIDVGSGAGLPGLPLAILRPDLRVTLLEPLLRRTRFLERAVEELDLSGRVSVIRGRAEEHRRRYEVVTARAVAPLTRLVPWCAPLRQARGAILALKGSSAAAEVASAAAELSRARLRAEILNVRAHPNVDPTTVVRLSSAGRR